MDEVMKAREYLKGNKEQLIEKFASLKEYPPSEDPFTIFMAGSPGAGKTETSKAIIKEGLIKKLCKFNAKETVVRIDADEIREIFREIGYDGTNTDAFKRASTMGVDKLYDFVLDHRQNVIIDGTFSAYDKSRQNVKRALKEKRKVAIFYIYLDPIAAWNYTKIRERLEGRSVSKEFFIESLFRSKENVNKIKSEFGKEIMVVLIEKYIERGHDEQIIKIRLNVDNIDNYLKIKYNKESLNAKLC